MLSEFENFLLCLLIIILVAVAAGPFVFVYLFFYHILFYLFIGLYCFIALLKLAEFVDRANENAGCCTNKKDGLKVGIKNAGMLIMYDITWITPLVVFLYCKIAVYDNYRFFEDTYYPIDSKVLIIACAIILLQALINCVPVKKAVLVMNLWIGIFLFVISHKTAIVEEISKHEVVMPITYELKNGGKEAKPSGKGENRERIAVIIDGQDTIVKRKNVKVKEYISRYDFLQYEGCEIDSLFKRDLVDMNIVEFIHSL